MDREYTTPLGIRMRITRCMLCPDYKPEYARDLVRAPNGKSEWRSRLTRITCRAGGVIKVITASTTIDALCPLPVWDGEVPADSADKTADNANKNKEIKNESND